MTYEEMRAMEETHACAVCGMPLVTIWDKDKDDYRLVCGTDRSHQGYQKILAPSQALARGKMDQVAGPGAQKALEKMAEKGQPGLDRLIKSDLGNDKALVPLQVANLELWGRNIGLKPRLGHVCLYFGKPYITVDGYYYLNNKRESPFCISTQPMSEQARKDYQLGDGDYGFIAEARDKKGRLVANAIGIATKAEVESKSKTKPDQFRAPVAHSHPQRMAEKRAEWQVLHKVIALEETA